MRRTLLLFLCCLMLVTTVYAAGGVSDLQGNTAVSSNGSCRVTLTVQMHLDEVPGELVFPLPARAYDITVNGGSARAPLVGNTRNVDLSSIITVSGSHSFTVQYALPDQITRDAANKLWLDLELLSGFAYPILKMNLSIAFPGDVEFRPTFTSTYHQEDVENLMNISLEGSTIRCTLNRSLNDREKLQMRIQVPETQFPQNIAKRWSLSTDDIIMYLLLLLAFIYWLFTMRYWWGSISPRSRAPEGISAGEVGCCLTGSGGDLTMMVLSWAEMGYLRIQLDENGRVLLHKRMDMGNERTGYENKYFRILFSKSRTVDTSGFAFTRLWETVSHKAPRRSLYRKGSGNPLLFRILVAAAGVMGGYSLARAFVEDTLWLVLLSILLCSLTAVASWLIQKGPYVFLLRDKQPLYIALGCSVAWLLLGVMAGEVGVAIFAVAMQWLGGFAAAYGGRRSSPGSQVMRDILGLRQFMTSADVQKLAKIQKQNPYYYYSLVPFAVALGVGNRFSARMGKQRLPECPYLISTMDGHLTAAEWNRILQEAVKAMDAGYKRSQAERFMLKK